MALVNKNAHMLFIDRVFLSCISVYNLVRFYLSYHLQWIPDHVV